MARGGGSGGGGSATARGRRQLGGGEAVAAAQKRDVAAAGVQPEASLHIILRRSHTKKNKREISSHPRRARAAIKNVSYLITT